MFIDKLRFFVFLYCEAWNWGLVTQSLPIVVFGRVAVWWGGFCLLRFGTGWPLHHVTFHIRHWDPPCLWEGFRIKIVEIWAWCLLRKKLDLVDSSVLGLSDLTQRNSWNFLFKCFFGVIGIRTHFFLLTDINFIQISNPFVFIPFLSDFSRNILFDVVRRVLIRPWYWLFRTFRSFKDLINVCHFARFIFSPLRLVPTHLVQVWLRIWHTIIYLFGLIRILSRIQSNFLNWDVIL